MGVREVHSGTSNYLSCYMAQAPLSKLSSSVLKPHARVDPDGLPYSTTVPPPTTTTTTTTPPIHYYASYILLLLLLLFLTATSVFTTTYYTAATATYGIDIFLSRSKTRIPFRALPSSLQLGQTEQASYYTTARTPEFCISLHPEYRATKEGLPGEPMSRLRLRIAGSHAAQTSWPPTSRQGIPEQGIGRTILLRWGFCGLASSLAFMIPSRDRPGEPGASEAKLTSGAY